MYEMGREQHTTLQKSVRREGEKIQFPLLAANQQTSGKKKGLNVQQESTCSFTLLLWDFSVSAEILGAHTVVRNHLVHRLAPVEETSQHAQAGHGLSPWQTGAPQGRLPLSAG